MNRIENLLLTLNKHFESIRWEAWRKKIKWNKEMKNKDHVIMILKKKERH